MKTNNDKFKQALDEINTKWQSFGENNSGWHIQQVMQLAGVLQLLETTAHHLPVAKLSRLQFHKCSSSMCGKTI